MARYLQRGIYKLGELLLEISGRDYRALPSDDNGGKEAANGRRRRTNTPTGDHIVASPPPRSRRLVTILTTIIVILASLLLLEMSGQTIRLTGGRTFSQSSGASLEPAPHKALIIASHSTQDVTWLAKVPKDWKVYRYVADNPFAKLHTPRNQGREAMAYLTYLINNYDNLPDYMVFHHGHYNGWHQPEPSPFLLQALNLTAVRERGYVNLRCTRTPGCEPPGTIMLTTHKPPGTHWASYLMQQFHPFVFRPGDPWFNATEGNGTGMPGVFSSPCCAQFAVTREAALSKPHEFWKRLREPMLRDLEDFRDVWGKDMQEWRFGVVYERAWHYFFGRDSVDCADLEWCRNQLYQGRIHCDGKTAGWADSRDYKKINCTLDPPADKADPNIDPPITASDAVAGQVEIGAQGYSVDPPAVAPLPPQDG